MNHPMIAIDPEAGDLPHCTCGMTVDACVCANLDTPAAGREGLMSPEHTLAALSRPGTVLRFVGEPAWAGVEITVVGIAPGNHEGEEIVLVRDEHGEGTWNRGELEHDISRGDVLAVVPAMEEIDRDLAYLNFRLIDVTGAKYARAVAEIDRLTSLKAHARALAGLPETDPEPESEYRDCAPDCYFCGGQGCLKWSDTPSFR